MRQMGQVLSTESGEAKVKVVQHSACATCHHKCGLVHEMKDIYVAAHNKINAEPGENVWVEMNHAYVLRAALWAYIFPLLFLFAGVVVGVVLYESEVLGLVLGLFLLAISYVLIRTVLEPRLKLKSAYRLTIVARADNQECLGRNE